MPIRKGVVGPVVMAGRPGSGPGHLHLMPCALKDCLAVQPLLKLVTSLMMRPPAIATH